MASQRTTKIILIHTLLFVAGVFGQAVGNNPAPETTTAVATSAPATSIAATSAAQVSATSITEGSSAASSAAGTSTGATSNAVSTESSAASSSASSSASTTPSATFATTDNPSTSTDPPLPTLSGVLPPPLIVPDTSNAPFMQKSNLPEGTVFICVGAALGFLGLCVLAWRGLVAWSLHRSVRRAAEAAYAPDTKSMFGWGAAPSTSGGYKSMYADSNMSLEALSTSKAMNVAGGEVHGGKSKEDFRNDRRASQQPKRASKVPPDASLFFSPTATGGKSAASANRNSTYMPAGYYAPGSSQANSGNPVAHFGRGSESVGYGRLGSRDGLATPSPPESPSMRPQSRPQSTHLRPGSSAGGATHTRHASRLSREALAEHDAQQSRRRSKLAASGDFSLNAPPTGRAPSMYLEDLFENHGHGPEERF